MSGLVQMLVFDAFGTAAVVLVLITAPDGPRLSILSRKPVKANRGGRR